MRNTNIEQLWQCLKSGLSGNIMAGPCAVESHEQLVQVAEFLKNSGISILRAGAFKPRTLPGSFQGLGKEGVRIIHDICKQYDLISISEVMDIRDLDYMVQRIDIIQVGSRNMFNYSMLKELARVGKPILLKRGLMATLNEFINAAEYIRQGNEMIMMCERGIRSFDTATRNILDLSCVPILKQNTDFPVVVDLSHSLGRKDIMIPMAKASMAAGADMIMLEVHPEPQKALSDAKQQLSLYEFERFLENMKLQNA